VLFGFLSILIRSISPSELAVLGTKLWLSAVPHRNLPRQQEDQEQSPQECRVTRSTSRQSVRTLRVSARHSSREAGR
jgi:hypothetical protein